MTWCSLIRMDFTTFAYYNSSNIVEFYPKMFCVLVLYIKETTHMCIPYFALNIFIILESFSSCDLCMCSHLWIRLQFFQQQSLFKVLTQVLPGFQVCVRQ